MPALDTVKELAANEAFADELKACIRIHQGEQQAAVLEALSSLLEARAEPSDARALAEDKGLDAEALSSALRVTETLLGELASEGATPAALGAALREGGIDDDDAAAMVKLLTALEPMAPAALQAVRRIVYASRLLASVRGLTALCDLRAVPTPADEDTIDDLFPIAILRLRLNDPSEPEAPDEVTFQATLADLRWMIRILESTARRLQQLAGRAAEPRDGGD